MKRIQVTIDEYGLTLASPPPEMRKLLQVGRHVARTPRDGRGTVLVEEPEKFYVAHRDNRITLPRGAWRFVKHAADRLSYALSVISNSIVRLPWQVDDTSGNDESLRTPTNITEYLAANSYGLVTYNDNQRLVDVIANLVTCHPDQTVGLVTTCVAHVGQLRQAMEHHKIKAGDPKSGVIRGVLVGVAGRFRDPPWLDMAVTINAGKQLGRHQNAVYRHGFRARQLALVDERVTLNAAQRQTLLVRYGFEWQRALPGGKLARSIVMECFKAHRSPQDNCGATGTEFERALVWRNTARNRQIARCANRNLERRPVVLAASIEHAAELAWQLQSWRILLGDLPNTSSLLARQAHNLRQRIVQQHTGPVIVTRASLDRVDWQEVDILTGKCGSVSPTVVKGYRCPVSNTDVSEACRRKRPRMKAELKIRQGGRHFPKLIGVLTFAGGLDRQRNNSTILIPETIECFQTLLDLAHRIRSGPFLEQLAARTSSTKPPSDGTRESGSCPHPCGQSPLASAKSFGFAEATAIAGLVVDLDKTSVASLE